MLKTLWDVLQEQKEDPKRINVLCKLLYCRLSGSASSGGGHHSSFELFVTDSSVLKEAKDGGTSQEMCQYMKIVGNSCHVLPKELREAGENSGTVLWAKHLLSKGIFSGGLNASG